MLELRAHADANVADECVRALDAVDGVTHITLVPSVDGTIRITADIDPPAVDAAFVGLERAGVPPDSMGVWRADSDRTRRIDRRQQQRADVGRAARVRPGGIARGPPVCRS